MFLKSKFYTSFTVDNKTASIFQIVKVLFTGLDFPCIKNVCREPETPTKCYANPSIREFRILWFGF